MYLLFSPALLAILVIGIAYLKDDLLPKTGGAA